MFPPLLHLGAGAVEKKAKGGGELALAKMDVVEEGQVDDDNDDDRRRRETRATGAGMAIIIL